MNRSTMRRVWALVFSVALVAAACGDDDGGGAGAPTTTAARTDDGDGSGGDEPTTDLRDEGPDTLRVTTLNLCLEVGLFWAVEKGFFEEAALDVELIRSTGGSAALAAVVGGSADLAFANTLSSILAFEQGFPVRYIASLYHVPVAPDPEVNSIIVPADSDIQSPEDLVGGRIGVNELGGINQLVTQNWLRKSGVDPTDVSFVALPFPELAPAVVSGRIDAAQVPVSTARAVGDSVRSIGDPYRDGPGELVFAGYLVTEDFEAEQRHALQRFQQALIEATEDMRDDPERFDVMGEYCPTPADTLRELPETNYQVAVDFDLLQRSADLLVEEGQLPEVPDIEDLVPAWARTS